MAWSLIRVTVEGSYLVTAIAASFLGAVIDLVRGNRFAFREQWLAEATYTTCPAPTI